MNQGDQDTERLGERVIELERKVEELQVLAKTERTDLTVRPPFKQDRALREYYSKACVTLAQISIGTAVATFITKFISPNGITLNVSLLVLVLLVAGFLLIDGGGKLQPPSKENYGC